MTAAGPFPAIPYDASLGTPDSQFAVIMRNGGYVVVRTE